MPIKICKTCKTEYVYNVQSDLADAFYFKGGYFRNTCKSCERAAHSKLYSEGTYDYGKEKREKYFRNFEFGSNNARSTDERKKIGRKIKDKSDGFVGIYSISGGAR